MPATEVVKIPSFYCGADADELTQTHIEALVDKPVPNPLENLVVIGNGLDMALDIPSSYKSFQEYVKKQYRAAPGRLDEELAEIYEVVSRAAGPDWQNFEEDLGYISLPREVAELDGADEGDLSELEPLMQTGADYAATFRTRLSEAFTDWVHGLPKPDAFQVPAELRALMDNADGILNFNYTRTLEDTFKVPSTKVLHVHGVADGLSELYFGCPPVEGHIDGGGSNSVSCEARTAALAELLDGLTKVPRIQLLDTFLEHASNLATVSSFGFSFGEADIEYVGRIIERCDAGTVWTAHCHRPTNAERARDVLESLDFPGHVRAHVTDSD